MINRIDEYNPELALIRKIEKLEQKFKALKVGSQTPTIKQTNFASVQFNLAAPSGNVPKNYFIIATLSNPANAVLMGYPQSSLFLQDPVTPDIETLFPYYDKALGFGKWGSAAYKKYEHIIDVNQWFSYGRTDNRNIVSVLDIKRNDYGAVGLSESDNNPDGATSGTLPLELWLSWRYIRPGIG